MTASSSRVLQFARATSRCRRVSVGALRILLASSFSITAGAADLNWCQPVTLSGTLQQATAVHSGNGSRFSVYTLALRQPIIIPAGECDGARLESAVTTREVQIKQEDKQIARLVGKTVAVTGELTPPANQYDVRPAVLSPPVVIKPLVAGDAVAAGRDAYKRGDYTLALREYRAAAEAGEPEGQTRLGRLYEFGSGVPINYPEAAKWYRLAADQDWAEAKSNLGVLYVQGHGVERDYARAIALFKKASDQGFSGANHNLGLMYLNGWGVAQNPKEAARLIRLAAEAGIENAQQTFGEMVLNGNGVSPDPQEAVRWFRQAAEQGYGPAFNQLGWMAEGGVALPKSPVLAHALYSLALADKVDVARANLKRVRAGMSADALGKAAKLQAELSAPKLFRTSLDRYLLSLADGSPTLAASGEPPDEWKVLVAEIMNRAYGMFNAKQRCWIARDEEQQRYCMKVVRHDWTRPTADGISSKLYLLAAGEAVDEDGEPNTSHASAGLVGAFIAERRGTRITLVSSVEGLSLGSYGKPPESWSLDELGPGVFGWRSVYGSCHQGNCVGIGALLVPHGSRIIDVGFPVSFSNAGACGEPKCEARASDIKSRIEIDTSKSTGPMYPLAVTLTGRHDGRPLDSGAVSIPFDTKRLHYVFPKNWALNEIEY